MVAQKHRNRPTYGAKTRKSEHKRFACKQIIDCASVRLCSDCRASKVHRFGAGVLASYGVPRAVLRVTAFGGHVCYVLQLFVQAV